jgi:DNA-directed RNA polymerase subunit beta
VHPGDILVGKITPKGESPMTPEEKLLRAIFGEKARTCATPRCVCRPGVAGTIVEVRVFNRHGIEVDDRTRVRSRTRKSNASPRTAKTNAAFSTAPPTTACATCCWARPPLPRRRASRRATTIDEELLARCRAATNGGSSPLPTTIAKELEAVKTSTTRTVKAIQDKFEDRKEKLRTRRRTRPGRAQDGQGLRRGEAQAAAGRQDGRPSRQQGRHLRILPVEDMPFLEDGTPVDIVLNPLGVPSRMNVGQIFETHLGWAARGLGQQITKRWKNGAANPDPEAGAPPKRR